MPKQRKIKGKEVITDLRAGLTPAELMAKYQLSPAGLRKIFRIILDASIMNKEEIESLPGLYKVAPGTKGLRRYPRKRIDFPFWVYAGIDQHEAARILDISERGIKIIGMRIKPGDVGTFVARFGVPGAGQPVVFEAVCRWVDDTDKDTKQWVAGLEITRISSLDSRRLQDMVLK